MTVWPDNATTFATTADTYVPAATNAEAERYHDDLRAIGLMVQCRRQLGWGIDDSVLFTLREFAGSRAGAELMRLEALGVAS